MFRPRRSRKTLEKHLEEAHKHIAKLESDPYLPIARSIAAEVREGMDVVGADVAYDQAVAQERERLKNQFLRAFVANKVQESIQLEEAAIKEQAKAEAVAEAAQQLEVYRRTNGIELYQEILETERAKRFKEMVETEKEKLRTQAIEALQAESRQRALQEFALEDPRTSKDYNKERAAIIRKETGVTKLLNLDDLQSGDVLDIDFVLLGKGDTPFKSGDSYYGYTENQIEVRKMKLRLQDPTQGTAIVEQDEGRNGNRIKEIYPMTPVQLFCLDPVHQEDHLNAINKAAPLMITSQRGDLLVDGSVEVWRVDLNGFRVLS